ncbi:Guanylyl cyclase [Durusdinium trenchii]|uniref:Membrane (DdGCA) (GCA) n=1 Tax=Durusdinium trenchii TaxID=1381693 RepID=A0ABP0H7J3_9DINO
MLGGAPGTVQFGKETKEYVSDDQVVDNSTRPNNGIVTMKGKGDVQTWVLKTREGAQPAEDTSGGKRQSVLQMITGATVEVDQDDKFDSIMDEQLAEDETEFSAKEEAQWFSWWHHKNCKTFGVRMSFLTFLFSAVTLAEILHMEHIRAWREDDNKDLLKVRGYFRVRLYLFFRFVAFAILIVWSVVANSKLQWLRREGRSVQVVLVGSKVLISLLVWLSYNVLVLEKNDVPYQNLNPLEYVNQQFSLVFMVAFFVIINGQVLTFYASLVFIPLAFFFMALEDKTPLYVSFTGRVVFLGVACLSCVLAEEGERSSRARFRSKAKVRKTQARIENVLKTLMPAQVLRELRANPGKLPSHEYKHATIAQSDLCGFTQLSSGRKPQEVVGFMGELFGRFDVLANEFGIYKVETVGDAYIAGMAETCLTETNSALRVVEFGLAMIKATAKWSQRLRAKGDDYKDANIRCRVGVHHGECVGGIVGTGMMRYHLFGEFMSIVDILEATSKEGICQISDACKKQIELEGGASNSIKFEEREDELKTSKGEVHSRDEVGGKTFLVYPAITEDRVRDLEEGLSELTKKVNDLEMRTSGHQDE